MNTERHLDDKDKHPVECVQMAKYINKKTVLSERQNATHSTGEAILQRHEEEAQLKIKTCGSRVRGVHEFTAV